jgi:hypothetical protein
LLSPVVTETTHPHTHEWRISHPCAAEKKRKTPPKVIAARNAHVPFKADSEGPKTNAPVFLEPRVAERREQRSSPTFRELVKKKKKKKRKEKLRPNGEHEQEASFREKELGADIRAVRKRDKKFPKKKARPRL